jgi:outer membrane protein assembly factor BamB
MGIYTPIEVDKRTREVVKSKFTLMNDKGEILWKQDNIDPIFISNTGKNYVSIQHFEDPNLYFYDAKGTLLTKVTPIKKIDIFPGCGGGSFSHNGEFFLILTQYPSVLICYTKAGKEIWRHNLADWGGAMRISPNDTYIGAVAIKQGNSGFIYLFDIKGNLKWRKKIPPIGNWNIAFSPESSYLGIAGSQIYTFETATGKRVWKYKDAPSIIFKSISISSNGEYILASAVTYNPHRDEKGRVLSSPPPHGPRYIYLFNKKGNKIWKKDVSGKSYKNWEECPNISISKDGKEITIGVGNTLLYYKVF